MKKNVKDFYLGLDIGTNSVGWAVTDLQYKPLRINNKPTIGVRLFNSAQTAVARRANRTARRRLERRKERISLLKSLFAEQILQKDANFFARLEDSNLYQEDKRHSCKFSLFSDNDYTDRDFLKEYPTIYHLRKAMMTEDNPDVRKLYLAIHHVVKYRGHFLMDENADLSFSANTLTEPFTLINSYLADVDHKDVHAISLDNLDDFATLLMQKGTITAKQKQYCHCLNLTDSKPLCELMKLIAGGSVALPALYPWLTNVELTSKDKVAFKSANAEEQLESLRQKLQDDFVLVEQAYVIYQYGLLKSLLGNYGSLSLAMVAKYQKHKTDLAILKKVIRKYYPNDYETMFGDSCVMLKSNDAKNKEQEKCFANYSNYVNNGKFGKRKLKLKDYRSDKEEFYKFVKKVLQASESALQDADVQYVLQEIENETFMPRQVSKDNATLPYQLNKVELESMLNNAMRFEQYDFLRQKDQDGVSVAQKIVSLLTFRMPYYVGPINNASGKYWAKRIADGKVYPWNLNKKIDLAQTEEEFIRRATNECRYVKGQKVLPKCSLMYEEYALLNVINKIRFNQQLINVQLKNKLSNYFKTSGKPRLTRKQFVEWLVSENEISKDDVPYLSIEGFDEAIECNRRSYYNMSKILGQEVLDSHIDQVEQIILWATVAGPEKSNLKRRLQKHFGNQVENGFLDESQIKQISSLTFKGWGSFSERFLTAKVGTNNDTGEVNCSIIDLLRDTNYNLSELMGNDFAFRKYFERSDKQNDVVTYDDVDELYCSPSVKKQIWQAVCVVNELKKVLGAPKKIFVEMARGIDKEKQRRDEMNRSISRKKELQNIFDNIKKQQNDFYNEECTMLFNATDPKQLQSKKLYLYFLQNGKDIYTGERINYNNFEEYDIDHVIPRSKIKDDSLHNNLVLTYSKNNKIKEDNFPISAEIQQKMKHFWGELKKQKLMTQEKYNRLTRTTEITADECAQFINRQLVETQQSTKEVCALLKRMFVQSNCEVVYSKASNVSAFRDGDTIRNVIFPKVREINDLHHAKDAYLNIVVGNVWNTRFGHDARVYLRSNMLKHVSTGKLFEKKIESNGVVAWTPGEQGTICQVKKVMRSSAVLFTRESFVQKGQLFHATLYPKGGDNLAPLKTSAKNDKFAKMSDTQKYGGFNNEKRSYFMLVEHTVKKAQKYTLLGVVARLAPTLRTEQDKINYCESRGYVNAKILVPQIKIDTMFKINGTLLSLSGLTGNRIVWKLATQTSFDESGEKYVKSVISVLNKMDRLEGYKITDRDGVTRGQNVVLYKDIVEKLSDEKLKGASGLGALIKNLNEAYCKFESLSLETQCAVLVQMLKALKCDATVPKLNDLGKGTSGTILISNTFDSLDNVQILHRSVTGLFESEWTK